MNNNTQNELWDIIEHSIPYVPDTQREKEELEDTATQDPDTDPEITEAEEQESKQWSRNAAKKKKEAYRMINSTAKSVFDNPMNLQDYLLVQANFNRYSVRNALLIAAQMPSASVLHSYTEWKQGGYSVRQGVKGVAVLEPGNEYIRRDGSHGRYMDIRTHLDISQVIGEVPQKEKTYDTVREQRLSKLSALVYCMNNKIKIIDTKKDPDILYGRPAFYNNGIIYADSDRLDFTTLYPVLATEIAHAHCERMRSEDYSRQQYGAICEFAGFMVCKKQDVTWNSALRIPESYRDLSVTEKIMILDTTRSIFNGINSDIEKSFRKEQRKHEK